VPVATRFTPSRLLSLQLLITLAGALLLVGGGHRSPTGATAASALYGLGMSSIFPIAMTLPGDLGMVLDVSKWRWHVGPFARQCLPAESSW
jgi:hypothetical protein